MGDGGGLGEADGLRDAGYGGAAEVDWGDGVGRDEGGGAAVIAGGIVLMNGLDGDAVGSGAGGLGEAGAPVEMGVATDAEPIDGAEDDGLLAVGVEDDAFGEERGFDAFSGYDEGIAEGGAGGRSDVDGEGGQLESGPGREGRRGAQEVPSRKHVLYDSLLISPQLNFKESKCLHCRLVIRCNAVTL